MFAMCKIIWQNFMIIFKGQSNFISGFESAKLRALNVPVPYVLRALLALVPHVPCVIRALLPHVSRELRALVSHVPHTLRALVPHVLRALHYLVPQVLTLCALEPHVPRALRALMSHRPRVSCAFGSTFSRASCLPSFMCQYHLFCSCFQMLHVTFSYSFPTL